MNYHMAIDMWSLGCILAELYLGYPIFPGENEQEQLSCIMEVLGVPDKEFVNRSSRKKLFFGNVNRSRYTPSSLTFTQTPMVLLVLSLTLRAVAAAPEPRHWLRFYDATKKNLSTLSPSVSYGILNDASSLKPP